MQFNLRLETTDTGREIAAEFIPSLKKQKGKKARFRLSLLCKAPMNDGAALNDRAVLMEKSFIVKEARYDFRFKCPPELYTCKCESIEMVVEGDIHVNDSWIDDSERSKSIELPLLDPPGSENLDGDPSGVVSPRDEWSLFFTFSMLAPEQKRKLLLRWATLPFVAAFLIYGAWQYVTGPGDTFLEVLIALGVLLGSFWCFFSYSLTKSLLGTWLDAKKATPSGLLPGSPDENRISPATRLAVSDWFSGTVKKNTRNLRLRVVAANLENYCRDVGGPDSEQPTYDYIRNPSRAVVLFDREVEEIPAGTDLQGVFTGQLDFGPVFSDLLPPQMIENDNEEVTHGISLRLAFHLMHPEGLDRVFAWGKDVFDLGSFFQPAESAPTIRLDVQEEGAAEP